MDREQRAERYASGKHLHRTQAWAIQIDDLWFAGFRDRRGLEPQVSDVKLRTGLCEAKLIGGTNDGKAEAYLRRLRDRGLTPRLRLVAMIPQRSDL